MESRETPLISVIIPAYNHENFIGPAIESVLAQTVEDFELVIIDDGSTDATAAVIQGYGDPRLRFFQQENQDAYNTINRGLDIAVGRYISILNSDDLYTPDRFERILGFIEQQQKRDKEKPVAAVFTDVTPISDTGDVFSDPDFGWNRWHRKNRDFYHTAEDLYTAFLKGNFMVTTSNLFMTAEAAAQVGRFCSLRYFHDYDYIFRLILAFPDGVHYLADEKLLFYRIHAKNTLGEAAIIGREQDQELITRYMGAVVPKECQAAVQAGAERLVELGRELHEVRSQLVSEPAAGVRASFAALLRSLWRWGKKNTGRI